MHRGYSAHGHIHEDDRGFQKTSIFLENTPVSQPIENAGYKYPRFIGHDLPGLTADQLLERAVRNADAGTSHAAPSTRAGRR
jgi:hypothetical protein